MDAAACSISEGPMALPDKGFLPLNIVFKGLRKKVLKACPSIRYVYAVRPKVFSRCLVSNQGSGIFTKRGEYYPHIYRLNIRELVQFWRITFRAVPVYCRTALFICSESDTSLMNYIIFQHGFTGTNFLRIRKKLACSWSLLRQNPFPPHGNPRGAFFIS